MFFAWSSSVYNIKVVRFFIPAGIIISLYATSNDAELAALATEFHVQRRSFLRSSVLKDSAYCMTEGRKYQRIRFVACDDF
jgi:hypothetical protein